MSSEVLQFPKSHGLYLENKYSQIKNLTKSLFVKFCVYSRLKNNSPLEHKNITFENRVAKYTIEETSETSAATFTVKAKNEVGTAETTCELKIQEPPTLTVDETLISQKINATGQWKVEAKLKGFPKPEVTWTKNKETVVDKRVSVYTKETSSTIEIYSLTKEDSGTYTVTAVNEAGSAWIEISLKVIGKFRLL